MSSPGVPPTTGETATAEPGAGPPAGVYFVPEESRRLSPFFELRREIPGGWYAGAAAFCLILCTGIWWYSTHGDGETRLLGYNQLPSMKETAEYFPNMWDSASPERHLVYNTLVSLKRVILGFSMALAVGIPLGVLAGCFALVRGFLSPLLLFGRNIPVAALTALVFALFGTGELQKVMFIFIACAAFIVSDTVTAVQDVGQRYVETALTLGASRRHILFKVLVPLAMPAVFNSLRILFGLAFGYIMLVEIVQEGDGAGGLGYMLNIARRRSRPEIMVIIVLTIPLIAWLIDQILYLIQCRLFRWKYSQEAHDSLTLRLAGQLARLFWK